MATMKVRMSNTMILPGRDDPEKILTELPRGLLVKKMGGGQVNTVSGDFVFDVEEGFHVKEGKKTLVRGATLLGNGPQVLKDIDYSWHSSIGHRIFSMEHVYTVARSLYLQFLIRWNVCDFEDRPLLFDNQNGLLYI